MSNRNPDPELIDKERQVLELRRMGVTYDEIAKATGYATAQGALLAYKRALKRTLNEAGAQEAREEELDRLDRLQRVYWAKAINGDVVALDRVLKIMEHRAKYRGLYAPARMQVEATVYDSGTIIGELERIRAIIRANRGEAIALDRGISETGAITD